MCYPDDSLFIFYCSHGGSLWTASVVTLPVHAAFILLVLAKSEASELIPDKAIRIFQTKGVTHGRWEWLEGGQSSDILGVIQNPEGYQKRRPEGESP